MVLAARGSKITLNGKGWVFADSVKAKSSIGADRSGLTLKAHRISAVLRKTELFEREKINLSFVEWDNEIFLNKTKLTR